MPGGGNDPACGVRGAKGDERIKYAEADAARENPKKPVLNKDFLYLCQRFFALCDQKKQDQKNKHVSEAQAGGPRPVAACETHGSIEDEGAAKE